MEEALQYKETAQFIGLPTASPRSHRYDGDKAGHARTFKPDHSMGAGHDDDPRRVSDSLGPLGDSGTHAAMLMSLPISEVEVAV